MKSVAWFERWMPLSQAPFAAKTVVDNVYQVEADVFLFTVPYNRAFEVGEESPYVTSLLFAPSLGALARCLNGDLSADTLDRLNTSNLQIAGIDDWRYESLARHVGSTEAAEYGNHGKFLHVRLEWRTRAAGARIEAYFRERSTKAQNEPYVVRYLGVDPPKFQA